MLQQSILKPFEKKKAFHWVCLYILNFCASVERSKYRRYLYKQEIESIFMQNKK